MQTIRAIVTPSLFLGLFVLFAPAPSFAAPSIQETVAKTARDYAKTHSFNGTILVERHGSVIYEESFGIADRAFDVAATNETRYRVASITKAFTSVIILKLYEENKIDLNGSVKQYLPDFHGEGGERITVQNLLNSTSGLPNLDVAKTEEDTIRMGLPMYETLQSAPTMIERYCTGHLVHPIGKVFDYNNCDYIILGRIIEKVTGKSFEDVLKDTILLPLGMSNSGIRYRKDIIQKLAETYQRPTPSSPYENDRPLYNENLSAAGAMYSTAGDLKKFSDALFGGKLLRASTLQLMLTPALAEYADGVWVRKYGPKNIRVVERYGRSSGLNVLLACFPDDDLTIILLDNTDETDLGKFYHQIAQKIFHQ